MKNLLVPIDFSKVSDRIVATAEEIARAFKAKIWLLHCVRDYPLFAAMEEVPLELPDQSNEMAVRYPEQNRQLAAVAAPLMAMGISVEPLLVVGMPGDEILYVADQYQIDLIIIGSHGHGALYDLMVGSVAHAVLQQAHCLTLVVPPAARKDAKDTSTRK